MQKGSLTLIFLLLLIAALNAGFGCSKKTDCCAIVDTAVQIHYKTQAGNNLINSSEDYNESNIRIYYKNGTAFEYMHKENLDNPNFFGTTVKENGDFMLTVYPSYYYEGIQSTTLIALNLHTVDLADNKEICKQAWLNGIEMPNRYIEIAK